MFQTLQKCFSPSGGAVSAAGEEALLSLLESLRVNMRTPPVGAIPLDPLTLEDQIIELKHPALNATVNLDSMAITVRSSSQLLEWHLTLV